MEWKTVTLFLTSGQADIFDLYSWEFRLPFVLPLFLLPSSSILAFFVSFVCLLSLSREFNEEILSFLSYLSPFLFVCRSISLSHSLCLFIYLSPSLCSFFCLFVFPSLSLFFWLFLLFVRLLSVSFLALSVSLSLLACSFVFSLFVFPISLFCPFYLSLFYSLIGCLSLFLVFFLFVCPCMFISFSHFLCPSSHFLFTNTWICVSQLCVSGYVCVFVYVNCDRQLLVYQSVLTYFRQTVCAHCQNSPW